MLLPAAPGGAVGSPPREDPQPPDVKSSGVAVAVVLRKGAWDTDMQRPSLSPEQGASFRPRSNGNGSSSSTANLQPVLVVPPPAVNSESSGVAPPFPPTVPAAPLRGPHGLRRQQNDLILHGAAAGPCLSQAKWSFDGLASSVMHPTELRRHPNGGERYTESRLWIPETCALKAEQVCFGGSFDERSNVTLFSTRAEVVTCEPKGCTYLPVSPVSSALSSHCCGFATDELLLGRRTLRSASNKSASSSEQRHLHTS